MSTEELEKVQRRRHLNKLMVKKYRMKRKLKMDALQEVITRSLYKYGSL